jgi:hypothetical protein
LTQQESSVFVRSKIVNGTIYYQLIEGYRDPDTGKVRQRTIASLGTSPTLADAIARAKLTVRAKKRRLERAMPRGVASPSLERELTTLRARIATEEAKLAKLEEALRVGTTAAKPVADAAIYQQLGITEHQGRHFKLMGRLTDDEIEEVVAEANRCGRTLTKADFRRKA